MVRKIINSILLIIVSTGAYSQGNFFFNQHGFLSAEIDTGTYINFIIEDSSLPRDSIQMAVNTNLKDSLIQFYQTETLYNNRVTVSTAGTERIFRTDYLGKDISTITPTNNKKIVNIVFEDEVTVWYPGGKAYYNAPFNDAFRSSNYENDISEIRTNTEELRGTLRYTGIVFWVDIYNNIDMDLFLDAVYNGTGVYSGDYGLEDRQELFRFYYSEEEKMPSATENRQYYTSRVLSALRDLGFNL